MPHFFCPELCEQNRKSSLRVLSLRTFLGFPPPSYLPISPVAKSSMEGSGGMGFQP